MAWAYGLRNLLPASLHILPVSGMPFDHARNHACQHCLQGGYDWLFSLDSDVVPPRDAILRLINRGKPFISGLYSRRSPPHGLPCMIKNGKWVTNYPENSVIEVDLVGAGCLLMHRSVLEKVLQAGGQRAKEGKMWFDWRVDARGVKPEGECLSEDFTLNLFLKQKLGIPTLVDTGVVCRHVGLAEAGPGSFAPLNTTPNT